MFRPSRRPILTAVQMMLLLNASMRRPRSNWHRPRPASTPLSKPTDLQRPLVKAHHDHTQLLADVHRLAALARTNLPGTPEARTAQEALDRAVHLTGQATEALRLAALATCPDHSRATQQT
ncbi:hypothetical protein ABT095_14555 [Kitasatospora sp. NPDC002227]|uniref:hypothetical protein n=1 Tax=Kitasatospora sp. NPDC002227 TaxID=3154773 RepID=UPI003325A1D8